MPFSYTKQPVKAVISDVTGTRVIDGTIYQNTSGRPRLVIVTVAHIRAAVDEGAYCAARVEDATPPTIIISTCGLATGIISLPVEATSGVLIFAVPNNCYYNVTETHGPASSNILTTWIEVEL